MNRAPQPVAGTTGKSCVGCGMSKRTLVCGVHPVLPAADVTKTVLFYEQQLGFVTAFRHGEPPQYVGVRRGMVELHIMANADKTAGPHTRIMLQVENIESIFREYIVRGLVPKHSTLAQGPMGAREFTIKDPNGISIVIYEDPMEECDG